MKHNFKLEMELGGMPNVVISGNICITFANEEETETQLFAPIDFDELDAFLKTQYGNIDLYDLNGCPINDIADHFFERLTDWGNSWSWNLKDVLTVNVWTDKKYDDELSGAYNSPRDVPDKLLLIMRTYGLIDE